MPWICKSIETKCINGCLGLGQLGKKEEEDRNSLHLGWDFFGRGDRDVLKLTNMMVSEFCEYTKETELI